MVGSHCVNLVEVRRFDEVDPEEPRKEQHREPVEDLVEVSLYEEEPSKTFKIGLALTKKLREDLVWFLHEHWTCLLGYMKTC